MHLARSNRIQKEQTGTPEKYPQGYFNKKPCRWCNNIFIPKAPSHLFCCQECADKSHEDNYFKMVYGISLHDYEHLLIKRNYKCAICGSEGFIMNKERHKAKLVVDHDHLTGKIRGLLCHNCNRALGLLHDDTKTLQTAIYYLEGATTIRKE